MGAALDTGNLGVSALGLSVITGLAERRPSVQPVVFDHGRGVREVPVDFGPAGERTIRQIGASNSRRFYRSDTLGFMRAARLLGTSWPPGLRALATSEAVLDISGGDSFTDLYGARRFQSVTTLKRLAVQAGAKLILLPQTYGPFFHDRSKRIARELIAASTSAWARDPVSYAALAELMGSQFDPTRHREGVDVAFALPALSPSSAEADLIDAWRDGDSGPLVGVNVSGLLYNNPEAAGRYGLKADYREVVHELVRRLLVEAGCRVVLVPHVVATDPHESDILACRAVVDRLRSVSGGRLEMAPVLTDPRHAKWMIAKFDWFCGMRMHSTIAALSSGVPTAAIAYSDKTRGVFETCGQAAAVADPRVLETRELFEHVWESWCSRAELSRTLRERLPHVVLRASAQMDRLITVFDA